MSVNKLQALNNIAIKLGGLVQAVNEIQAIDNINALIPAGGLPISGIYVPVASGLVNVTISLLRPAQFLRVGNTVTVSGLLAIVAGAIGNWVIELSLPVASNFTDGYQLAGSMNVDESAIVDYRPVGLIGSAANNTALFIGNAAIIPSGADVSLSYIYAYTVLP